MREKGGCIILSGSTPSHFGIATQGKAAHFTWIDFACNQDDSKEDFQVPHTVHSRDHIDTCILIWSLSSFHLYKCFGFHDPCPWLKLVLPFWEVLHQALKEIEFHINDHEMDIHCFRDQQNTLSFLFQERRRGIMDVEKVGVCTMCFDEKNKLLTKYALKRHIN